MFGLIESRKKHHEAMMDLLKIKEEDIKSKQNIINTIISFFFVDDHSNYNSWIYVTLEMPIFVYNDIEVDDKSGNQRQTSIVCCNNRWYIFNN